MKGCVIMENENIKTEEQVKKDNITKKVSINVLFVTAIVTYAIGASKGYKQGMKDGMVAGKIKGYTQCLYDVINRFQR